MTASAGTIQDIIGTNSIDEPVFYPEGEDTYFGFISSPASGRVNTTGVVLLSGTFGGTTTIGRNRMWVKMARTLADQGISVLRFDYAGIGDSVGEMVSYELESPAVPELKAAFDLLESRGVHNFIVVGTCYGSRTALVGSAGDPRVKGIHLLVPPVRSGTKRAGGAEHLAEYAKSASLAKKAVQPRTLRRLLNSKRARRSAKLLVAAKARSTTNKVKGKAPDGPDPTREAAPDFHRPLRTLLADGVPVHMLFGTDDFFWTEFQEASSRRLGEDLERFSDLIEVETVPGTIRGFLSIRVQDVAIDSVIDWVRRLTS